MVLVNRHQRKSKGDSVQQPTKGKKTFYDRWGWIILIGSLSCVPFAFFSAGKAIQSNVNKIEDWLPKSFSETGELAWFRIRPVHSSKLGRLQVGRRAIHRGW